MPLYTPYIEYQYLCCSTRRIMSSNRWWLHFMSVVLALLFAYVRGWCKATLSIRDHAGHPPGRPPLHFFHSTNQHHCIISFHRHAFPRQISWFMIWTGGAFTVTTLWASKIWHVELMFGTSFWKVVVCTLVQYWYSNFLGSYMAVWLVVCVCVCHCMV